MAPKDLCRSTIFFSRSNLWPIQLCKGTLHSYWNIPIYCLPVKRRIGIGSFSRATCCGNLQRRGWTRFFWPSKRRGGSNSVSQLLELWRSGTPMAKLRENYVGSVLAVGRQTWSRVRSPGEEGRKTHWAWMSTHTYWSSIKALKGFPFISKSRTCQCFDGASVFAEKP